MKNNPEAFEPDTPKMTKEDFSRLITELKPWVLEKLYKSFPAVDRNDIYDVISEKIARLLERTYGATPTFDLDRLDPKGLPGWLFVASKNAVLNHLRDLKRKVPHPTMNARIKALLYSSNIWYLGEGMLGPLLAVYTERIGGDVFDISWAWAIYLIATGLLTILVGKLVKTPRQAEMTMVAGYAINTLFTFGYLLVANPLHLFLVQAGLGLASAMATPTWNTLYARHKDSKLDTFEWGLADGEANIITGISIVAGGFLVTYTSFQALFVIMGCVQAVATTYLILAYKKQCNVS